MTCDFGLRSVGDKTAEGKSDVAAPVFKSAPPKKVGENHLNETANCGTISSMAKGFKNATLALALTVVGVVASCRA